MPSALAKQRILEEAGYAYIFDRMSYVNRQARKVFSIEFVEEHSEGELKERIGEPAPSNGDWCFYFNAPPSEAVKRQLSTILG